MNITPKTLKTSGLILGFLFLFLATFEFMRTWNEGEPKWKYFMMICGMLLVLFYTLFAKTLSKKRRRK